MKNYFVLIISLLTLQISAQSDIKTKFQKNRYDLAISYFKKTDYAKAIDLFSLAYKIDSESQIGLESNQIVDTLKTLLRKDLTDKLVGTWKKTGDEPSWTVNEKNKTNNKDVEELMIVTPQQISFYQEDIKTKTRKLIKSEDLIFYDKENLESLYSQVIFLDKKIWSYLLDIDSKTLRAVNIGQETKDGIDRIVSDNPEIYYAKVK